MIDGNPSAEVPETELARLLARPERVAVAGRSGHRLAGALDAADGLLTRGHRGFPRPDRQSSETSNVNNLAADSETLQTYAEAITMMKALPATDARNWTNQASIHQNSCPHGTGCSCPGTGSTCSSSSRSVEN